MLDTIFVRKPSYVLLEVPAAKVDTKFDSLEPTVVRIALVEKTFQVNIQRLLEMSQTSLTKTQRNRANLSPSNITVTRKDFPFLLICYKTLSCNSGVLCIDWREIYDRIVIY